MIFVLLTFFLTVALVVGAYWVFVLRIETSDEAALRRRLQPTPTLRASKKTPGILKATKELSTVATLNTALGQVGRLTAPWERDITQAGLTMTVGTLFMSSACLLFFVYLVVKVLTVSTLMGMVAGIAASFAPFLYVKHMKGRRLTKFEEQFPEAIDLVGRSLRAGHAFSTGLAMAAEEIPAPVGSEFKLLYDRQSFGMPLPDAMRDFAERIPLIDARFFVTAVLTQRETGGNLGEVLDNLASVIRERFKVKRQVRVLTAHGRITGWILAGLPPGLAAALFVITPGHMMVLINDPLGVKMIVGALVLQIIGTLIIRKLVDIPY
jgi:tight adherence protein B